MTRIDRFNRILFAALGVACVATAAYGLARGAGAFGHTSATDPLLVERVRSFVGRSRHWFWPLSFVATVGIVVLGMLLTRAELARGNDGDAIHERDGADELIVGAHVIGAAIADDLASERAVIRASAWLASGAADTEALIDLTVADDIPVAELRRLVQGKTLARARGAIDDPALRARVTITLAARTTRLK